MKPFNEDLLDWYDRHARVLPWRVPPARSKAGERADPYHVWLSEVMLQQTQIATVRDYFLNFVRLWPGVQDLARTDAENVMKAWAGLGYYSRARNLKKCAEAVSRELGGKFPQTAAQLKELPGIGDYTSAAIAAIAFGEAVPVVDGNVERVVTRLAQISTPLPDAKPEIRAETARLLDPRRSGDFAQAMMDLGATICTPRKPACVLCPVRDHCRAGKAGDAENYPVKVAKAEKPVRKGAAFVMTNPEGAVFLRKRPGSGLLGGMSEVPGTGWNSRRDGDTGLAAAPETADWRKCPPVRHTFTHFHLELEVWHAKVVATGLDGWWSNPGEISGEALPSVMKKAIESAIPDMFRQ